jgi:hypothetical protein
MDEREAYLVAQAMSEHFDMLKTFGHGGEIIHFHKESLSLGWLGRSLGRFNRGTDH